MADQAVQEKDFAAERDDIPRNGQLGKDCFEAENQSVCEQTDDEKIDLAARHILERYRSAFIELAK